MASRVLGFLRDILIARVLGAGLEADAFFVAFRFPNLFRRLFAEGAFNAAFVPLYARALIERGPLFATRFDEETLALALTVQLALTLLAEIAMPWLMILIAPGFIGEGSKYDLAVQFTRITFPMLQPVLFVMGLVGTLMSFNVFDVIWLLTGGGPSSATTTLPVLIYDTAFTKYRLSQSAAISVLSGLILLAFATIFIRFMSPRQEEE